MARIAKQQAISPKMYRHFAVVTLAVTALLGFFADGENRDAAAETLVTAVKEQPKKKLAAAPVQRGAFGAGRKTQTWASDSGGGGGEGGDAEGDALYAPGTVRPKIVQPPVPMSPAMQLAGLGNLPDTPPPGMPIEVFRQLKREKQRLQKAGPQVTTGQDMARMHEQSRQRSGGEDEPADQAD